MSRAAKIILLFCCFIILLQIWGSIEPSHFNWGIHFFAFYESFFQIAALICIIIFLIPQAQKKIIESLDKYLRYIGRLPIIVTFILTLGLLIVAVYTFPVKLHLLGDGAVLLRSVQLGIGSDEISLSFRNQPLMFWIYKLALSFHPFESVPNPYNVYFTIDVIALGLYLFLIFWTMRLIHLPLIEKFLLGCFLFLGAGSQFFFGYVENYVLQYITTTAYLITAWFALEKRISFVLPIAAFIIMTLLHLGSLVFLPSFILLVILKWKNKFRAVLFLAGASILGCVFLYLVGFNLIDMTRHLKSGTVDFLQLFTAIGGNFPYPMFSFFHLLDWLNVHLLIVPFGLSLSIILLFSIEKKQWWRDKTILFLLTATLCGQTFTWVVNSALGMARDWDLFSSFFVPLLILPIYLFTQQVNINPRRIIIVIIVAVTFIHWIGWIGVNANIDRHLSRMKTLNSPKLLSLSTQLSYNEALANYFFDKQRYKDARIYYEDFLKIDSSNPRIIGNIADVYRRLDERQKYFEMLKRAVALNSPDPGIYSNIGVEYANRGDTAKAIEYNERAIKISPGMQKAHANLGVLFSSKQEFRLADQHYTTAINLGMREPLLFRYAGDVAAVLGDYRRAIRNYDIYLTTNPGDNKVRETRNKIYQILQEQPK